MKKYGYILLLVAVMGLLFVGYGRQPAEPSMALENIWGDAFASDTNDASYVAITMHESVGFGAVRQREFKMDDLGEKQWGTGINVEPLPMAYLPPISRNTEDDADWFSSDGYDKKSSGAASGWGWLEEDVFKRRADNDAKAGLIDKYQDARGWRRDILPDVFPELDDSSINDPYRDLYNLVGGE